MEEREILNETIDFIKDTTKGFEAAVGIILGTGLGALADQIKINYTLNYAEIPHFPVSTIESHSGRLVFGSLDNTNVICMQGRFHFYEGYSMKQVAYPVEVFAQLGVKNLLISNAAGGLNPVFKEGDLMIIEDHISTFLPSNPLIGRTLAGDKFPDMSQPYSANLMQKAQQCAVDMGYQNLHFGVYVSVPGPQLETKAEYRMLRNVGADAVGMSTVPEVIMGVQLGLDILAISVITDECDPENLQKAELSKILAAASRAEPTLTTIFKKVIGSL